MGALISLLVIVEVIVDVVSLMKSRDSRPGPTPYYESIRIHRY